MVDRDECNILSSREHALSRRISSSKFCFLHFARHINTYLKCSGNIHSKYTTRNLVVIGISFRKNKRQICWDKFGFCNWRQNFRIFFLWLSIFILSRRGFFHQRCFFLILDIAMNFRLIFEFF